MVDVLLTIPIKILQQKIDVQKIHHIVMDINMVHVIKQFLIIMEIRFIIPPDTVLDISNNSVIDKSKEIWCYECIRFSCWVFNNRPYNKNRK